MEVRLRDWVNRPDFSAIVEAVPCPLFGCRGNVGVPCYNLHSVPGTLAYNMPRNEYHSERIHSGVVQFMIEQRSAEAEAAGEVPMFGLGAEPSIETTEATEQTEATSIAGDALVTAGDEVLKAGEALDGNNS